MLSLRCRVGLVLFFCSVDVVAVLAAGIRLLSRVDVILVMTAPLSRERHLMDGTGLMVGRDRLFFCFFDVVAV